MKSDVQIAQSAKLLPIIEVARRLGLNEDDLELYGKYKAKISSKNFEKNDKRKNARLILVTAITPTPAGEGKTTVNVGLSMALNKIGKNAVSTLREPSLGPCFGIKGGAAGGGYAQVVPMEDINLHFTGDFHALTAANNLLASLLDNYILQANKLGIDSRTITLKRTMDMNDRALRNIVVALGGKINGYPREDGFDITAATELMAILCLATSLEDLKERISRMIVGYTFDDEPVIADHLQATGAIALLLKDAIKPNLVQTLDNTPAILHGGPFANIAHGCNSVLATNLGLQLSDYVVTEAGFGADLGAEKFFNIKCRYADLQPSVVVLVATVRALKYSGGVPKDALSDENVDAIDRGFGNLEKHLENIHKFGLLPVVALNKFPTDTNKELKYVGDRCRELGIEAVIVDVCTNGADGGIDLAEKVVEYAESEKSDFKLLYDLELPIKSKIEKIATEIYGTEGVDYTKKALMDIKRYDRIGLNNLPVCIAKTQYSLSDNPKLLGRPKDFRIEVREVRASSGAGFLVVLTGEMLTMPGLPKQPAALNMDLLPDGEIKGLF